MKLALYTLLAFLLFTNLFVWKEVKALKEEVRREKDRLRKALREARRGRESVREILNSAKELKLKAYTESEAYRKLALYLSELESRYKVSVLKGPERREGMWFMEVALSLQSRSGEELAHQVKGILREKDPVVVLKELAIDMDRTRLLISIYQPYLQ